MLGLLTALALCTGVTVRCDVGRRSLAESIEALPFVDL